MTTLSFPDVGSPAQLRWRLISNTQVGQSPLNKSVQTYELPGARWGFTADWPPLDNVQDAKRRRALMRAFLVELGGQSGRFTAYCWENPLPGGSVSVPAGSPNGVFVNGVSQTGNSLATRGWSPNATGVLLPGDFFGVNGELKMITTQADADASGNSTLAFRPGLRTSPSNGLGLVFTRPTATFMLTGDTVEWMAIAGNLFGEFSIDAVEAF